MTARPVELHISGQILGVEYIDRNHCREKQLVGGFKYVLPSGNRGNWKSPWPSHGGLVRKIVHQWGSFQQTIPIFFGRGCSGARSPLAGLGCGLPLSRLYAEYMGGRVKLQTMPRWKGIGIAVGPSKFRMVFVCFCHMK